MVLLGLSLAILILATLGACWHGTLIHQWFIDFFCKEVPYCGAHDETATWSNFWCKIVRATNIPKKDGLGRQVVLCENLSTNPVTKSANYILRTRSNKPQRWRNLWSKCRNLGKHWKNTFRFPNSNTLSKHIKHHATLHSILCIHHGNGLDKQPSHLAESTYFVGRWEKCMSKLK